MRRAEGKTVESTQINNIFYRRQDIEDFIAVSYTHLKLREYMQRKRAVSKMI